MSHTQSTYLLSSGEAGAVPGRPCTDTTVCPWTREACRQDTFRSGDETRKTVVRFGICQNPCALSPHRENTRRPAPRRRSHLSHAAVPGTGAGCARPLCWGTARLARGPAPGPACRPGTSSLNTRPPHGPLLQGRLPAMTAAGTQAARPPSGTVTTCPDSNFPAPARFSSERALHSLSWSGLPSPAGGRRVCPSCSIWAAPGLLGTC